MADKKALVLPRVTADTLLNLLSIRHSKDIFVSEIKTPPGNRRYDAYAVRRSWTQANTFGYEIKSDRRGFTSDQKWRDYLPWCNEFYFVCPPGVADPSELPAEAGLIVCSTNATRLYIKKRAPMREPRAGDLKEMFRAILICRFGSGGLWRVDGEPSDRAAFWRSWLARKRENQNLGASVSKRLGELVEERVEKAEDENSRLKSETRSLQHIKEMVEELGINPRDWQAERKVKLALRGPDPQHILRRVRAAKSSLESLEEELDGC